MTRTITTVEELDALPIGAIIRDADYYHGDGTFGFIGTVMPREEDGWLYDNCCSRHCPSDEVDLPATLIYSPDNTHLPDREQIASAIRGAINRDPRHATVDMDLDTADAVIELLTR